MHLTAAMTCLSSFDLIHTLPFIPMAASSGNFEPRRGRRKCSELGSLDVLSEFVHRKDFVFCYSLSAHFQAASSNETPFEFTITF